MTLREPLQTFILTINTNIELFMVWWNNEIRMKKACLYHLHGISLFEFTKGFAEQHCKKQGCVEISYFL